MEHVSSVHPTGKFPEKVENLKRWARFPGWNFWTECRVPFTFLVVCTSSRSTVGHREVPGFTTKWNNFLPSGNSTFASTEISWFYPPITNQKPWPFEPVNVKFCFPRGPLRWLTAAKNAIVSWLLNFRIRMFVKSAVRSQSLAIFSNFRKSVYFVPEKLHRIQASFRPSPQ